MLVRRRVDAMSQIFNRCQAIVDQPSAVDVVVRLLVHIRAIRQKLSSHASVIETVRGVGYRFRDPRHAK